MLFGYLAGRLKVGFSNPAVVNRSQEIIMKKKKASEDFEEAATFKYMSLQYLEHL